MCRILFMSAMDRLFVRCNRGALMARDSRRGVRAVTRKSMALRFRIGFGVGELDRRLGLWPEHEER